MSTEILSCVFGMMVVTDYLPLEIHPQMSQMTQIGEKSW